MRPVVEVLTSPAHFPFQATLAFVWGACLGSFFNVCIYRIPLGLGLSNPKRSFCYRCGQQLRALDNIPLLSYWLLGGKCRYCKAPYSIRYFLVELLTAAMFLGIYWRFAGPGLGFSVAFFPGWVLGSLLLIATFTDIDHWIIPDRISLGGAVAGIALAAIPGLGGAPHHPLARPVDLWTFLPEMWIPLANSIAGAAAGAGILWFVGFVGALALRREAMGMGDVKLAAMFGAFVGPLNCLFVLVGASFVGSFAGILGIVAAKLARPVPPPPAVAALVPDAERCARLVEEAGLRSVERLVATRALSSPGPVATVRHHLPFGPWLAVSALAVYLGWERIHAWLFFYESWYY